MTNNYHSILDQYTENDWKLFRKKIAIWQENYMNQLNESYIKLLSQDKKASDKFWELEKRMKDDKKKPGVVIDLRRSTMILNILNLLYDEVITIDDLNDFSSKLKEPILAFMQRN